jgi:polyisoprenoid-binding protein YceI
MKTLTLPEVGTWSIDPAHSEIGFVARHLMVSKVRGSFGTFDGTITIAEPVGDGSVEVAIDAASFKTGAPDRDAHIMSADFLDVERFPQLTFRSTSIEDLGAGNYEIEGDLTIRDATRQVTLAAMFEGEVADPWGGTRAAFTASTTINREDWGLTWNVPLPGGGVLVGREVTIELEIQAVKR